jgi:hypothetical protein
VRLGIFLADKGHVPFRLRDAVIASGMSAKSAAKVLDKLGLNRSESSNRIYFNA